MLHRYRTVRLCLWPNFIFHHFYLFFLSLYQPCERSFNSTTTTTPTNYLLKWIKKKKQKRISSELHPYVWNYDKNKWNRKKCTFNNEQRIRRNEWRWQEAEGACKRIGLEIKFTEKNHYIWHTFTALHFVLHCFTLFFHHSLDDSITKVCIYVCIIPIRKLHRARTEPGVKSTANYTEKLWNVDHQLNNE